MAEKINYAPGWPGITPRWTSSAKDGVGTSLNPASRLWFTVSHGILNEIYFPRIDQACTRDMGMIVTDGAEYFSDEKRTTRHVITQLAPGVPAYHIENTSEDGRYRIEKEVLTDPERDVLLQKTHFVPLQGTLEAYHVYVLLAPHIANAGRGNTGWLGDYKGVPMLFAERAGITFALACSASWPRRSAGFVGVSDGWQDLSMHRQMTWTYDRAENGNIALAGEIDIRSIHGEFTLALSFGRNAAEAGNQALASLSDGFEHAKRDYIQEWKTWQQRLLPLARNGQSSPDMYQISTAVMRIHESKNIPGGLIASLSVPWGFSKSDDDLGGYHLAWPRDLVESASGLLAAGAHEDCRRVLHYLQSTQERDGHWPQNMWLDGTPYWSGIQMDETALPVILVDLARREKALDQGEQARLWPMVKRAASFIVQNGPVTQQDRWEEDPGYSPFTLAAEIAALLCAADLADANREPASAAYLRETADFWNDSIEQWIYMQGTDLAKKAGVEGYYVRIAPPEVSDASSPAGGFVTIKNRPPGKSTLPASEIVSPDALALVRFGLRAPDDPRILNTVRVIDAMLRVDMPYGPLWHRYNDDGYGEHADGSPFDGTGIGRAWPLIAGERAHYELAAGRRNEAERLLRTLASCANEGGLIPEQIWDAPDIPKLELAFGKPSGSAMPLVWAHAEFVTLLRSLRDNKVFGMPPQTVQRYQVEKKKSLYSIWRYNHKIRAVKTGRMFRIEVLQPAVVHWSADYWRRTNDLEARDTGLGVYIADLPTKDLPKGSLILFTFYWHDEKKWEGSDYSVIVAET
ncbi:MAG: glucan 1,4-alpha-glucosidase [Nitrospiraceae bacterium]|nr:glucan 1,4-alpha-glucosidase [Nitrospiraceae bacterium]